MKKLLVVLLCIGILGGLAGCLFRAEETSEEAYETIGKRAQLEGRYFVVIRMHRGKRRSVAAAEDYLRLDEGRKAVFVRGSFVTEGSWDYRYDRLYVTFGGTRYEGLWEDDQLGLEMNGDYYVLVKGKSRAEAMIDRLGGKAAVAPAPGQGKEELPSIWVTEATTAPPTTLPPTTRPASTRTPTVPSSRPAVPTQPATEAPSESPSETLPPETFDPSWTEAQRLWNRGWYGFVTISPGCTGVFASAYKEGDPCYGLSGRFSLDASGTGTYFFVDRAGALGSVGERLTGSCAGTSSFLQILDGSAYGFSLRLSDAVMTWNEEDRTWHLALRYSGFMGKISATAVLRPWGESWDDTSYPSRWSDYASYRAQIDLPGDPLWN